MQNYKSRKKIIKNLKLIRIPTEKKQDIEILVK